MLDDEVALRRALKAPSDAALSSEDLSTPWSSITRVAFRDGDGIEHAAVVKSAREGLLAYNEATVLEALMKRGYPHSPAVLGFIGEMAILQWVEGAPATALLPPPGAVGVTMDALAALHRLDLREGARWGLQPEDVVSPDPPIYRLGFATDERDRASQPLAAAYEVLRTSPWGFTHGDATAANVLLRDDGATLTGWGRAGYGPQLFDVAAFLLTVGLPAADRRQAAMRYATALGLEPVSTADVVDLVGLLWTFDWLLPLPRRQIVVMGDDTATELLVLLATRIERAAREPAGSHPLAASIRGALWPS